MKHSLKVVFMGTPDFAVDSLKAIVEEGYEVIAVVTSPDKPAGRGLHINYSPVKQYALGQGMLVLQPANMKSNDFFKTLQALQPDVQVVVAFRMLPEQIWSLPPKGTFNLHASLLPQYRGAAPINHTLINGETETGLTTFFLNPEIDKGNIIFSEKIDILPHDDAGTLHDRMKANGALLVLKTLDAIEKGTAPMQPQPDILNLKPAPKIFKEHCLINWNRGAKEIHNFIRGLSPYPGAFTYLISPGGSRYLIKIFKADITNENSACKPGSIRTDEKTFLYIGTKDFCLSITYLQLEGKKKMEVDAFLRGFSINEEWQTLENSNKSEH